MALEVLEMEIGFVTVRAFILALRVLGRIRGRLASGRSGTTRMSGQHTAPSLLSHNMERLGLLVGEHRRMRI